MGTFQVAIADPVNCYSVNISAHPNYPPFHWKEKDTIVGASIDISQKIFERLGVEVSVSYEGPWKRVLMSAKQGKIDFIPALKKTSDRQEYFLFTHNEFSINPVAIFVRKGETKVPASLEDLVGLFGSINAGDKHGDKIDSFVLKQPNMQFIHGLAQNFEMLKLGRTDYFITGFYTGYDYLKSNELSEHFKMAFKINGLKVHNGFALHYAKECNAIIKEFDKQLSLLKQKGEIEQSINDYNELWLGKYKEH
ncbi:substrate-binding periplasmic protein [Thalassotalea eurytherma]|nr:transporter substrate-binding domain-containing protein [Thalassotalea eurytherma]